MTAVAETINTQEKEPTSEVVINDLDKIPVTQLKDIVVRKLEEAAERTEDSKKEAARELVKDFGIYIDSFDPRKSTSEDQDAFVELESLLGREAKYQVFNAYREDLRQLLTLTQSLLESQDENARDIAFYLIDAVVHEGEDVKKDEITFKLHESKGVEQARAIAQQIEDLGKNTPPPFHEFVENFDGNNTQTELNRIKNQRQFKYANAVEDFSSVIVIRDKSREVETKYIDNWDERVQEAKKKGLVKYEYDTSVDRDYIEGSFFRIFHKRHNAKQYAELKEEYVEVLIRDKKTGEVTGRKVEKVKVAQVTFYSTRRAKNLQEGEASGNKDDFKLVDFVAHNARYPSLASIQAELEELHKYPPENGKYKMRAVDENGTPMWKYFSKSEWKLLTGMLESSKADFLRKGFTLDMFEKEPPKPLREMGPTATSWVEYGTEGVKAKKNFYELSESMKDANEMHLALALEQVGDQLNENYTEFSSIYGHESEYMNIAKERLIKRGVDLNDANWKKFLLEEHERIKLEYTYKSVVYKEFALELSEAFKRNPTLEHKKALAKRLINADYELETRWLSLYLSVTSKDNLPEEAIGDITWELKSEQEWADRIQQAHAPFLRTIEDPDKVQADAEEAKRKSKEELGQSLTYLINVATILNESMANTTPNSDIAKTRTDLSSRLAQRITQTAALVNYPDVTDPNRDQKVEDYEKYLEDFRPNESITDQEKVRIRQKVDGDIASSSAKNESAISQAVRQAVEPAADQQRITLEKEISRILNDFDEKANSPMLAARLAVLP